MRGQSETETESIEANDLGIIEKVVPKKCNLQFVCVYSDCNAVFKRSDRLQRHLRQHSGERPFVCGLKGCFRSFSCKSYLNKHEKRPHILSASEGEVDHKRDGQKICRKQYVCNECNKSFKTKFQLRIHCFQHFGQKPFDCDKCDKSFVTNSKLKSHMKTHEGYACGREDCDYKASKWSELRKHISVLHKVCHKCDVCDKMFNNSYNLSLHKETIHSNEKIGSVCDNCGKTYSNKSNLMTHIRSQHHKQQFQCTQDGCDKTFLYKKSLNKHLENHSKPETKFHKKDEKKVFRRKSSKASKLTGIELNVIEVKELMDSDFQFRTKCLAKESLD